METALFTSPISRQLYQDLLTAIAPIGPFTEEEKKTCIHLVRGSAFAGVHPRKSHIVLTLKADRPIESPRIAKAEQTSKNRWHVDVKVAAPHDLDAELLAWLKQAYDLCP